MLYIDLQFLLASWEISHFKIKMTCYGMEITGRGN